MHQVGRGHDVAQEAEAGKDGAEGGRLRLDIQELDLQGIAGLGPLDVYRPGQGVHGARVEAREIRLGGTGLDLAVDRVTRLHDDLFPLAHLEHGRDVGMEPVVADMRLLRQGFAAVDADRVHGHLSLSRIGAFDLDTAMLRS